MPRLKLAGKKHLCACGAVLTYALHADTGVILVGCTNAECGRCFTSACDMHMAVGMFMQAEELADGTEHQS